MYFRLDSSTLMHSKLVNTFHLKAAAWWFHCISSFILSWETNHSLLPFPTAIIFLYYMFLPIRGSVEKLALTQVSCRHLCPQFDNELILNNCLMQSKSQNQNQSILFKGTSEHCFVQGQFVPIKPEVFWTGGVTWGTLVGQFQPPVKVSALVTPKWQLSLYVSSNQERV